MILELVKYTVTKVLIKFAIHLKVITHGASQWSLGIHTFSSD